MTGTPRLAAWRSRITRRRSGSPASAGRRQFTAGVLAMLAGGTPISGAREHASLAGSRSWQHPVLRDLARDAATHARLRTLDPERIEASVLRTLLVHAPAPRIIALQGSVPLVTMEPFSEFLIAMGYPAERLRNPVDGRKSYSSYIDGARLAGIVAWHYEAEAMMPMLVGHSQGGMVVIKALHELAGRFEPAVPVWNPVKSEPEKRTTIVDPISGVERPVVGLQLGYAAALATGSLPRLLLGQWGILPLLRDIPDSVRDFTGFAIPWDPIAGTGPDPAPFRATGTARVRNLTLPSSTSHIRIPSMRHLAEQPTTREWIERYQPGTTLPTFPAGVDAENLLQAADIWWSVRRQWCLEAQHLARAAAFNANSASPASDRRTGP